jgi:hypothetical protein
MVGKKRLWRGLIGAVILAAAGFAGIAAIEVALTIPAKAQFFRDDRYPFLRQHQRPGGFFGGMFGSPNRDYYEREQQPVQTDNSHAPSPRKPDPKAEPVTPTSTIVVMGDAMADWLAYGLEDAFSDSPEIAILRRNKLHSGLLRYEAKSDLDWWHVARDILAADKPNYVVMMLGISDRQNIRERDLIKEADQKAKEDQDKKNADKNAQNKDQADDAAKPPIVAPEPQPGKKTNGTIEFRSDQWAEAYSKRIDETIAALKSKGVPVFWVGLPSIRGTKSTADAVYLNDLYRARAERAGAIYIDVWDGFVDEGGKFTTMGPDHEGQMRRLRSSDGVFFTRSGARKLAYYVERELRRAMNNRLPVALPSGPLAPAPPDPKVRPVAGPVVPLTVTPTNSEELLGGGSGQPPHTDATAARVLVKGEPVPAPSGRADDFAWPLGSDSKNARPVAAAPPPPAAGAHARTEPAAVAGKPSEESKRGAGKTSQTTGTKRQAEHLDIKPKPVRRDDTLRPPGSIPQSGSSPGWLR